MTGVQTCALPIFGRFFPADDPTTRGIASGELIEAILGRVRAAGFEARAVDVTIVGARPDLGAGLLEAMRTAIAGLLDLDVGRVSVKASSGNLAGDEGAGRVVSARAVATVAERAAPPDQDGR